jgi:hypothetical protein
MTTENKKYLVYGGVALLVGSLGYFIYNAVTSKPIVVEEKNPYSLPSPTPEPAPKVNPFTALLGKKFEPITFKPFDYSVKNPFANTNTAIANNLFSSSINTGERLA